MPKNIEGEIIFEPEFGSIVMRFTRTLPRPPRQVWDHLLDKAHLHEWLTSEPGGYIRRRAGGEVLLPTIGGAVIETIVHEYLPAESLVFAWESVDWDGGEVGWGLEPARGGATLRFDHSDDDDLDADHYARTMATWCMTLDRFEASLAGVPVAWDFAAWEKLYYRYGRWLVQELELEA